MILQQTAASLVIATAAFDDATQQMQNIHGACMHVHFILTGMHAATVNYVTKQHGKAYWEQL